MLASPDAETLLWSADLLTRVAVVWRIWSLGISRNYRWFVAFWVFSIARTLALFSFSPRSWTYYYIWIYTQPVLWLLAILVVLELFRRILQKYQGLQSASHTFFLGTSAIAVLVSVVAVALASGSPQLLSHHFMLIERGVYSTLSLLLIGLVGFVWWFPIPVARNLVLHVLTYTVFFGSMSISIVARNLLGTEAASMTNLIRFAITITCQLVWIFLLSRQGEDVEVDFGHRATPEQEDQLLAQLDAINQALASQSRRI